MSKKKFEFVDDINDINKSNTKSSNFYLSYEMRVFIMVILVIILFIVACLLIYRAFTSNATDKVTYSDIGDSSYRVCSNANGCYNATSYTSSSIDTINIKFKYKANYSKKINYSSNYYVVAKLKIYDNNKILYEDEDLLIPSTNIHGKSNKLNIKDGVSINYDDYNKYVVNYRQKYLNNALASVNVLFYVDDKVTSSVNIPLGVDNFPININDTNHDKLTLITNHNTWSTYNCICALLGLTIGIICLVLIIKLTKFVSLAFAKQSPYEEELNAILKNYDHDIITTKHPFNSNSKVISVKNFKELFEVHENLEKPIIYSRINSVKSEFTVVDDNIIYSYIMKEADFK